MIDFQRLFSNFKIEFTDKRNRGWTNVWCPYCADSYNHYQLGFSDRDEFCSCWKCGWHPMDDALSALLKVPRKEAMRLAAQYRTAPAGKKGNKFAKRIELPTRGFTDREAEYLKGRGFDPRKLNEKYGVVGGGETGRWAWRIVLPLLHNGTLISWTGRSILPKSTCDELEIPRYLNLSKEESVLNPKDFWFNADNARGKTVLVVEGPFDALRMGDGCVSPWGSEPTERQKLSLARGHERAVLMLDGDPTGRKKSEKLAAELSALGMEVEDAGRLLAEVGKKDPAELSPSEAARIRETVGL